MKKTTSQAELMPPGSGSIAITPSRTGELFLVPAITAYLKNGGTIEHAQQIARHESPKTTKLYDRTSDQITLDEIERIVV